ncbi:MAG: efflux RND transporter periplasmic adaptor subunit [Planctomycetia bacterium]|nr:efflux RND transporter periplasmic adaptor subunit [Planctomycetia bacterium]
MIAPRRPCQREIKLAVLMYSLLCFGCSDDQGAGKVAGSKSPANVPKVLNEAQVNVITLTPAAVERLHLQYGTIERTGVRRVRIYGGEVLVPAGKTILVAAPLSGVLQATPNGVPQAGTTVAKGTPLFTLLPLLSPESRVTLDAAKTDAQGQFDTATAQLGATRIALDRAKRVFQTEAGSRRAVDDAQALFDVAQEAVEAAQARLTLLERALGATAEGTAAELDIVAPQAGLLRAVLALPDQQVPVGAPLVEIVNLERGWVRVPVYVGDLTALDREAEASIVDFTAQANVTGIPARPVVGPPSANPTAGTVDLFYEFDNPSLQYNPGQRVGVNLMLRGEADALSVPWNAVVQDVYGGSWVYAKAGEHAFERRRVSPRYLVDGRMVLADGPPEGTAVVTDGSAELFGTETGFSK